MGWLRRSDELRAPKNDRDADDPASSALADFFSRAQAPEPPRPAAALPGPAQALRPRTLDAGASAVPALTPLDDAAPAIDVDAHWEVPSAPAEAEPIVHAMLTITPQNGSLVVNRTGPVAHVVLALDLSASMNRPDKYPLLQRALASMLSDLRAPGSAEVRLSVVAFGRGAGFIVRDVSSRTLHPDDLLDAIDASPLLFTNYTDVAGALEACCAVVRQSHDADRRLPIRVVVLTDGKPQDVLGAESQVARLRRRPADIDCLCFGEDADVAGMKRLVCGGRGGTVKHVTAETIEDAFGRIGEVAQRVVAKIALVDVELCDGVAGGRAYRFRPGRHDFGTGAFGSGRLFSTDLGTLEAGRTYSLVFRLRLPASAVGETEVGRVTLRIPGEGGPRTYEVPLFIARHAGSQAAAADPVVRQALEILGAGEAANPSAQLASLRARRTLHVAERRDARSIAVIDRAIALLEAGRSLDDLTPGERAVLQAHTRTVHASARRVRSPLV